MRMPTGGMMKRVVGEILSSRSRIILSKQKC